MTPYYADDTVTLYHGDCREILPQLNLRADLIVADPPYESTSLGWDVWPAGWLEAVAEVADSMWCWLPLRQFAAPPYRGMEFAAAGWKLSQDIQGEWDHMAWEKHNGSGFAADRFKGVHEIATHWYRGRWSDVHHETPRVPGGSGNKSVRTRGSTPHTGNIGNAGYADDGTRLMRSVVRCRSMQTEGHSPHREARGCAGAADRVRLPARRAGDRPDCRVLLDRCGRPPRWPSVRADRGRRSDVREGRTAPAGSGRVADRGCAVSRGRTAGRCRHDGKTTFRTFEAAASAGRRLTEPGTAYWCPHAGGFHVRRGDQADYDRRQAEGRGEGAA